jgi:hypothetical protein
MLTGGGFRFGLFVKTVNLSLSKRLLVQTTDTRGRMVGILEKSGVGRANALCACNIQRIVALGLADTRPSGGVPHLLAILIQFAMFQLLNVEALVVRVLVYRPQCLATGVEFDPEKRALDLLRLPDSRWRGMAMRS